MNLNLLPCSTASPVACRELDDTVNAAMGGKKMALSVRPDNSYNHNRLTLASYRSEREIPLKQL